MLKLISPAKINLFLNVTHKRADGYHELVSLFQTVSLCDNIEFSLSSQDELKCSDPAIPKDSSNLIIKALDLFRCKTGLDFCLKVYLEKKIPHQAGLGGGSSNAATTLWALNALHGFPVDTRTLMDWSKEIGSDITFFLSQGTALCLGRGEIVLSQKPLKNHKSLYIVKPSIGLSTPEVFKALDAAHLKEKNIDIILKNFHQSIFDCFNDLEAPALKICPQLIDLKNRLLESGFEQVTMTGSGSAFFCFGEPNKSFNDLFVSKVEFINREESEWYSKTI